ncbi:MAG: dTMP kinase [Firmicutes bacterium]|jgi:dTMP kinase|nr:dTMP kinase [Bacillota bacterium]
MKRGKFIVFEGIDGAGCTTEAVKLKNHIDSGLKLQVHLTKEPTDGPVGGLIRSILAKRIGTLSNDGVFETLEPHSLALLFAADRLDHLEVDIEPKLDNGVVVICDRYYLSSLAYQSLHVDIKWLEAINAKCITPDLTIFIQVPPLIAERRRNKSRWHVELYEETAKLEQVAENYLRIIEMLRKRGQNIVIIDGNRPPREVERDIKAAVRPLLTTKAAQKSKKTGPKQGALELNICFPEEPGDNAKGAL